MTMTSIPMVRISSSMVVSACRSVTSVVIDEFEVAAINFCTDYRDCLGSVVHVLSWGMTTQIEQYFCPCA